MKKIYLTLGLLSISQFNFGQLNTVSNEKVIGSNEDDILVNRLEPATGTDYFLVGGSRSNTAHDKSQDSRGAEDLWIVKMDKNHNKIWDKTIGGNSGDFIFYSIIHNDLIYCVLTSASGVFGEKTTPGFGDSDIWVVCLNLDGAIQWQQSYGGSSSEDVRKLLVLQNGNILIGGTSNSYISGNKTEHTKGGLDYWLVEIDPSNGNLVRQKTLGSTGYDFLNDVTQDNQGNIYVLGSSDMAGGGDQTATGHGMKDLWLLKLDENYTIIAEKSFGGEQDEVAYGAVCLIKDDYIYLLSNSYSGVSGNKTAPNQGGAGAALNNDYWVVKADLNLNAIWDRSYGGSLDDHSYTIFEHHGDIFLSGSSFSPNDGNKTSVGYGRADSWFLRINTDGNLLRQITIGGDHDDYGEIYFSNTQPDKIYYCGSSRSSISGMKSVANYNGLNDFWIMELKSDEFLSLGTVTNTGELSVFPNPFNEKVTFNFPESTEDLQLTISMLDGKTVYQTTIFPGQKELSVQLEQTNSLLIYTVQGNKTNYTGKLIGL